MLRWIFCHWGTLRIIVSAGVFRRLNQKKGNIDRPKERKDTANRMLTDAIKNWKHHGQMRKAI